MVGERIGQRHVSSAIVGWKKRGYNVGTQAGSGVGRVPIHTRCYDKFKRYFIQAGRSLVFNLPARIYFAKVGPSEICTSEKEGRLLALQMQFLRLLSSVSSVWTLLALFSFSLLPWLDEKIIIPRERSVMGNEIIPAPFVLALSKTVLVPCVSSLTGESLSIAWLGFARLAEGNERSTPVIRSCTMLKFPATRIESPFRMFRSQWENEIRLVEDGSNR